MYEENTKDLKFDTRYGISLKQSDDIASRESSRVVEIFEGTLNDTIFLEFDDYFIQLGYEYASPYHNDLFVEKLPKDQAWQLMDLYRTEEEIY